MMVKHSIAMVLAAATLVACASTGSTGSSSRPAGRSDVITSDQMRETQATNLYEAVQRLHPEWMLQRNASTIEAVYEVATHYNLTGREREALEGISAGLSSKELAKQMNISPNTVKAYLRIIMVKMGVNSRAAIVARILEQSSATPNKLVSAENRKAMRTGA